eukprot:2845933-Amphidinium_carterae.1
MRQPPLGHAAYTSKSPVRVQQSEAGCTSWSSAYLGDFSASLWVGPICRTLDELMERQPGHGDLYLRPLLKNKIHYVLLGVDELLCASTC